MQAILETTRFSLCNFSDIYASDFYELNNDPEVLKYTGDHPFYHVEEAKEFLKNYNEYGKHKLARWVIIDKKDQLVRGWCGLKMNADHEVDLGFRLKRTYWNQGIATETSKACLKYGFETIELQNIIARTSIKNKGAQRVLGKLGMEKVKTFDYEGIGPSYYYNITKQAYEEVSSMW